MKTNKPISILFIFLICLANYSCSKYENNLSGFIDADNSNIQYIGRFDRSNPKKVLFDWPGVYIRAKFEGTSCTLRLKDGKNYYAITIDDEETKVLKTDSSNTYLVASELKDISHTILIQKRTESSIGIGEFYGFILDEGKQILKQENEKERKIEFIGNSITCGYGVEGKTSDEPFMPSTENAALSFASLIGKSLNADYSMIAYSGKGVARNYGDKNKTSAETMPFLYERTYFNNESLIWDYTSWIPQVVVINLGTNDYSTKPYPDKKVFKEKYVELINRVQQQYPGVSTFCICPIDNKSSIRNIKEVVSQFENEINSMVYLVNTTNILNNSDYGSDWHPNISGQQKIANVVLPVIKKNMNW